MNTKFLACALALIAGLFVAGTNTSCTSTGGVKPLEEMTELDYSKFKVYIQLGVKIGANRLLEEGVVTTEELNIVAAIIDGIKGQPVSGGIKSLIAPALQNAGFKNAEIEFILVIVEQELLARGALDWINPETGLFELSPRTQDILTVVADALRTANTVTSQEKSEGVSFARER